MSKDYRCSDYCRSYDDISVKKNTLLKLIRDASRHRNMYRAVSKREERFNQFFKCIYHGKCAYCGVDMSIVDHQLFEVDHFICKDHTFATGDLNIMSNLMNACRTCNGKKLNLMVQLEPDPDTGRDYQRLLNPDFPEITDIFFRDSQYRIQIADEYKDDLRISEFHRSLVFGSSTRRLDYLLLQMRGLRASCGNNEIQNALSYVTDRLQSSRNYGISLDSE